MPTSSESSFPSVETGTEAVISSSTIPVLPVRLDISTTVMAADVPTVDFTSRQTAGHSAMAVVKTDSRATLAKPTPASPRICSIIPRT